MKKTYIFSFLLLCCAILLQAQKRLEIDYTANNGNYTFQYKNPYYCDYTVKVEFPNLQGGICSCVLPLIESIPTGSGTLLTIKPLQANQSISFNFGYRFLKGRMLSKEPKPFLYALPFSSKTPHRASTTQNINEVVFGKKVANFYGISFLMNKGDTVFAARRGVVSEMKNDIEKHADHVWFSTETNYVEVFQQDGTFMRYNRFKKGTLLVKEGDEVEVGQPLGIVADDTFEGNRVIQLTAYYLSKATIFAEDNSAFTYLIPRFYTKDTPTGTPIQPGVFYTADCPESLITQEMTKRVLKKWRENKK